MRPEREPIGLELTHTNRDVSRAFNDALVEVGGSLPQWLVVMAIKQGEHARQRDIAASIGIEAATLTHHLNRMEADGVVRRDRPPGNRRSQLVTLTPVGEELFTTLLGAVIAFDEQLRQGFSDRELATLRRMLDRLRANADTSADREAAPP